MAGTPWDAIRIASLADLWQVLDEDELASAPLTERPIWKQLQDAYVKQLSAITIAALCDMETGAIDAKQEAA